MLREPPATVGHRITKSDRDRKLAHAVIVVIALVNGLSVFSFWVDHGGLGARLLGSSAAAVVSYLAARVIAA